MEPASGSPPSGKSSQQHKPGNVQESSNKPSNSQTRKLCGNKEDHDKKPQSHSHKLTLKNTAAKAPDTFKQPQPQIKNSSNSLSYAVYQLGSSKQDRVLEALVNIRKKFIRDERGVARFRELNGLDKVLSIIKQSTSHKHVDIALSILGNCCMEKLTRKKVSDY